MSYPFQLTPNNLNPKRVVLSWMVVLGTVSLICDILPLL